MAIKITYDKDFDERDEFEASSRGVISGVIVDVDEKRYKVDIYNYKRAMLMIEWRLEKDECFMIVPGTIIMREDLNLKHMEACISRLSDVGYFDLLLPIN
ncbi:hypothetical protein [Asticcacaulis sp. AC460]|uniref:hypothetical protein n=1 Tax=Asticcacaulis sp. AC460 TaxID=1282360 RepID=UPI0012DC0E63|nr:hypothetical protein [Asticcacaulis sp. AC460]